MTNPSLELKCWSYKKRFEKLSITSFLRTILKWFWFLLMFEKEFQECLYLWVTQCEMNKAWVTGLVTSPTLHIITSSAHGPAHVLTQIQPRSDISHAITGYQILRIRWEQKKCNEIFKTVQYLSDYECKE